MIHLYIFPDHANRRTVKTDDVLLAVRKDKDGILAELQRKVAVDNPVENVAKSIEPSRNNNKNGSAKNNNSKSSNNNLNGTKKNNGGKQRSGNNYKSTTKSKGGAVKKNSMQSSLASSSSDSSSSSSGDELIATRLHRKFNANKKQSKNDNSSSNSSSDVEFELFAASATTNSTSQTKDTPTTVSEKVVQQSSARIGTLSNRNRLNAFTEEGGNNISQRSALLHNNSNGDLIDTDESDNDKALDDLVSSLKKDNTMNDNMVIDLADDNDDSD